jgi:sulfite reductase (NADPH) flavoprotein alpha-component
VPVIIVDLGTGIAPFRAFLQDCKLPELKVKTGYFLATPEEKLTSFTKTSARLSKKMAYLHIWILLGCVTKKKIYVQNLMLQQGLEIWKWLEEDAAFYVCGDASRMAKDVDAALLSIAKDHGKLSDEVAAA